jgi:hypothetical protein
MGWKAAGLLLAATAASPALAAEGGPGAMALPEDIPPGYPPPATARPAARQAPTAQPDAHPPAIAKPDPLADVAPLPPPRPAPLPPAESVVAPPTHPAGGACGGAEGWSHWWGGRHSDCQAHMWGYAEEFRAPPLGATIHAHYRTMVANGTAAAMMLYRYDFIDGTEVLNQRGRDQLTRIATMLHDNAFPIIIERTPEAPALAEARRAAILNVLALNAIPVPPGRIVIAPPIAYGLSGADAEVLYNYQTISLSTQAAPLPATGTVSTGVGGFGSAGGGFGGGTGGFATGTGGPR